MSEENTKTMDFEAAKKHMSAGWRVRRSWWEPGTVLVQRGFQIMLETGDTGRVWAGDEADKAATDWELVPFEPVANKPAIDKVRQGHVDNNEHTVACPGCGSHLRVHLPAKGGAYATLKEKTVINLDGVRKLEITTGEEPAKYTRDPNVPRHALLITTKHKGSSARTFYVGVETEQEAVEVLKSYFADGGPEGTFKVIDSKPTTPREDAENGAIREITGES